MKKRITNFGFSTILISFTMICVVLFSALALITANSDLNLSKKYADKNYLYYETENKAYKLTDKIDTTLLLFYEQTSSEEQYFSLVTSELSNYISCPYNDTFEVNTDGTLFYKFDIELSTIQYLHVSLQINYPYSANDSFLIIDNWQLITDTSVEDDNTLNLIQ